MCLWYQALLPESLELPSAPTASLPPGCVCSTLIFNIYCCCLSALWLSSRHHLMARQIQMQPVPRMERRISLGFMPISYILVYCAMVVLQISPYKEIPRKITPPKISIFLSFVSPLQGEKNSVSPKWNGWLFGVNISLLCVVVLLIWENSKVRDLSLNNTLKYTQVHTQRPAKMEIEWFLKLTLATLRPAPSRNRIHFRGKTLPLDHK